MTTIKMYLVGSEEVQEWFLSNDNETTYDSVIEGEFIQESGNTGWFKDTDSGCYIRVKDGRTVGTWQDDIES